MKTVRYKVSAIEDVPYKDASLYNKRQCLLLGCDVQAHARSEEHVKK